MSMNRMTTAMLVGCALLVASAGPGLAGQAHDPQHAATDQAKAPADMAAKDHAMMADHEKMMTAMKAADQRLDTLITTMNAATGMAQPAATAAVVTEMVAQSRTMRENMMKSQQSMMAHMMEHMQAGPSSMAACPMMPKPMPDKTP
ncbi:MAG: hypothetical protein ABI880_02475 [Acidobacteriota bacterium]